MIISNTRINGKILQKIIQYIRTLNKVQIPIVIFNELKKKSQLG